jgi:WD40 repeat protein
MFEHSDGITCVEKNFKDPKVLLSAGRDSQVNVWRFCDEGAEDVIEYHYDFGMKQLKQDGVISVGGVQKAKWLDELVIVMGLADGTVQMKDIRTKKEELAS